ncbi:MAG: hypothetical protein R3C46_03675 [Hyphomonadaceae bacterium]
MRYLILAIMLPLAACATPPEAMQTAAIEGKPAKVEEPARVCWSEIVTGTRSRRQTVCRTEKSEQNSRMAQDALKDMQDRSGASGPPPIMGGG